MESFHITNIARDDAQVGIQLGAQVVHQAPASAADVAAELGKLCDLVERAYLEQRIDAETVREARAELAVAHQALPAENAPAPTRFVNALGKLRGLLGDVAGIAKGVGEVLQMVGTLR